MRTATEIHVVHFTSDEMHRAARTWRAALLADFAAAAIQAAVAIARRAYARYRQRTLASATYDALSGLDDRALRDLGFDRSELSSVAAEATGAVHGDGVRKLWTVHGFPSQP